MPGNLDIGGIETFVMNIYRNLDRSKIQFDFIVHKNEENYFEKEIISYGGKIYRLTNKSKHFFEYKKQFLSTITKYSIIHIHSVYAFSYFEAKWAKESGKTVILHSHNSNAILKRKVVHYLLRKPQLKYLDMALYPSEQAYDWMFGKKNDQFFSSVLLHNGFKLEPFKFKESSRNKLRTFYDLGANDIAIGCVARLDRQKDPEYLLRLFEKLIENKSENMYLFFVGEGSKKKKLKRRVNQKKINDNVKFVGNVNNVSDYLSMMDIFVLPTRYEGLGISIVEAQINGVPIVTSNNIPQEAIKNVSKVTLLPKNNFNLWVDAINSFVQSNNREDRYVDIEMFKDYDINVVTKKLCEIYLSIKKDDMAERNTRPCFRK